jgi:hypothetical protein
VAERKPLTLVDNRPGELPASDNLPYTVLPQAWTHPALGAPLGSMLVYAAIARGASPPDTFGFWATETNEASTDALVTITGVGYLGFDLVNSDRARDNLGLGAVATLDVEDLISTDSPNALSVGSDGRLVATGGGGGGGTGTVAITFTNAPFEVEASIADPITVPYDWEIVGWRLRGGPGQSGTATVDWLLLNDQDDTGVSITASLTPTVNGTSNESTTLTGWTTTGTAGQLLQAVLTNVTGFKQVVCELLTVRT